MSTSGHNSNFTNTAPIIICPREIFKRIKIFLARGRGKQTKQPMGTGVVKLIFGKRHEAAQREGVIRALEQIRQS